MGRKSCVIYCRVSSDKQVAEGHGLDGQELNCRRWAEQQNYQVLKVFREEGVSGTLLERPQINALYDFVENAPAGVDVVMDSINRVARDTAVHFSIKKVLEGVGSKLRFTNIDFDDTPEGEFMETIFAASAALEGRQNRQRVIQRQKARLLSGYWAYCPPAGYKYDKLPEHGKLMVRHEPDATMIAEAFQGYASGRFCTVHDVYQFLKASRLKSGKSLVEQSVHNMLRNPLYAGFITKSNWDIKMHKAKHKPIVDLETFQKVQDKLSGIRPKLTKRNLSADFPVRGFVNCITCNTPLTASWSTRRDKIKEPYYRCHKKVSDCMHGGKSIKRDLLHDSVRSLLEDATPSREIFSLTRAITERLYQKRSETFHQQAEMEKKQVKQLEKQIEGLIDTLVSATPAVQARLNQRIEDLEIEKKDLERRLVSDSCPVELGTALDRVFEFMKSPLDAWDVGDYLMKQRVQRLVFNGSIIFDKSAGVGTADYRLPFKVMRDSYAQKSNMVEADGFEPT